MTYEKKLIWNFMIQLGDSSLEIRESSGAGPTKNLKPHSTWTHVYLINLASVEKKSKHLPCSNRPVVCRVYQQVIRSYNMGNQY